MCDNTCMQDAQVIARIRRKYRSLEPEMDERSRRQWAATEARDVGWGGITAVAQATGYVPHHDHSGSPRTDVPPSERAAEASRVRRAGGGRQLFDGDRSGSAGGAGGLDRADDAWRSRVAVALDVQEYPPFGRRIDATTPSVRAGTVATLLREAGYSLQANRKTREGASHPDRNAQFEYINASVQRFLKRGQPAISVDAKKKEKVGDFKNGGREWLPQGKPEEVRVYDFLIKSLGKVTPYGVYDLLHNQGWVSVGIDHDTAQFAVNSIRRWWNEMGQQRFPRAKELLITADGGGSNSHRSRLWKVSLQELGGRVGDQVVRLSFSARHQQVEQD